MPVRLLIFCSLLAAASGAAPEPVAPPSTPSSVPHPGPAVKPRKVERSASADRDLRERATRELLQKLPPEKRRQVLDAMKHVWADEDVRAAREELRRATEAYRRTLRAAMEETDPDVHNALRPLLDRLLKSGLNPATWTEAPGPDKPAGDGPPRYLRLLGLSGNAVAALTPEERALLGSVRDRVMADVRVRQAAAVLPKPDQPRGRGAAIQELRRVTRTVAIELEPRLQPLLEKAGATPPRPAPTPK